MHRDSWNLPATRGGGHFRPISRQRNQNGLFILVDTGRHVVCKLSTKMYFRSWCKSSDRWEEGKFSARGVWRWSTERPIEANSSMTDRDAARNYEHFFCFLDDCRLAGSPSSPPSRRTFRGGKFTRIPGISLSKNTGRFDGETMVLGRAGLLTPSSTLSVARCFIPLWTLG